MEYRNSKCSEAKTCASPAHIPVGLGCVLADLADMGAEEPTAETVCRDFGEGGRLIEIFNMDQMTFLQTYLMQVSVRS